MKIFLCLCMTVFLMAFITNCESKELRYNPEVEFKISYMNGGTEIAIIDFFGSGGEVIIPPKIQDLPVTLIANLAFAQKNITSITIPNSVTNIGFQAFFENKLTEITIPANVKITEAIINLHGDENYTFPFNFNNYYKNQGHKSGTYTYINDRWRIK